MATEPPKHKRRWFRFSLKTFVVVLTVFCVWLGLFVHRVNKQREAVLRVTDMGGTVNYDYELNVEDAQPPGPDWLRELVGIDYFADVKNVVLTSDLTSYGLTPLENLTSLEMLHLPYTQVRDLTPLTCLASLEMLDLTESPETRSTEHCVTL